MPYVLELSPSQRSALADFIAEVSRETGGPIFDETQCSDLQLVVLGLMAADSAEVEYIGEFFLDRFGLSGIDSHSLATFLACVWAEKIDGDIRAAAGGQN
jgi:hypothetical protein